MKALSSCSAFFLAFSRRDHTILINKNKNNRYSRLIISRHYMTSSATTTTIQAEDSEDERRTRLHNESTVNFLGPPHALASLSVGDTTIDGQITRLSSSPDLFLIRNHISSQMDRDSIKTGAIDNGMKLAGTTKSDENTVRKNSYLTWMNPYELLLSEECNQKKGVTPILLALLRSARSTFVHSTMNDLFDRGEYNYCMAEDVQVAKYDIGGMYNTHHDGYGRFLTVLTYLNGVGGTYFPFANNTSTNGATNIITCQREAELAAEGAGNSGLLVVGIEGIEAYNIGDDDYSNQTLPNNKSNITADYSTVQIQPGDAVAFYNYNADGEKEWKSLHESRSVPREKWIVTNWFRSESLTGSLSSLYKASLLDEDET